MAKLFFIVPHNEGQELNYIEDYKGDMKGVEDRAFEMFHGLVKVLKGGSISVVIQDDSGKKIKEIM